MTNINEIYLGRLIDDGKETIGFMNVININEIYGCFTLELPWLDNKKDISCIPTGRYEWDKYDSPSKGLVIRLKNVPERTFVEIHIANYKRQLRGCIAVGVNRADIDKDGLIDVVKSKVAFDRIMDITPDHGFINISKIG